MKVRGQRRCKACDTRWSYYETGSPACPSCGSIESVGVDEEPTLHTDGAAELDLGPARAMIGDRPTDEVAAAAQSASRSYLTARGFVAAGELLDLDDVVLAAAELRYVGGHLRRAMAVDDATEAYFLDLLAGGEAGDRPSAVPSALRPARGLASAEAVEAYRRDVAAWLDEHPHPEARPVLDQLRVHERRIAALDGDVRPDEADALVAVARDLGDYLRTGDESALVRAETRLDGLG